MMDRKEYMQRSLQFETALGKLVKVEILESFRRGGKTCHLLVDVR